MLGDGEIFQAERVRRSGHVLQRIAAVGRDGVRMQIALEIGVFDKLGQASGARGLDLAAIFPKLGRDEWQTDGAVDGFLGLAGDTARALEDAIFVDLEPPVLCDAAQRDVVCLGACEVDQRGAEALRGNCAQIDLEAAAQAYADSLLTPREHLGHFRILGEALRDRA